jgi:vacuolar-type H+-ATPase subunit H
VTDYHDDQPEEDFAAPSPYGDFASEQLLLHLRDLVVDAPKVPLSASAMISREEVLALLDEAIDRLPDELRAARWLLKERDEFLTKVRHEGDEIVNHARAQAEQFVQRTEVVKAAEQRAWEIVDRAEADARRLQHEVEDFCDQKLASFEIVLERTMGMVASGRAKLQGINLTEGIPVDEGPEWAAEVDGPLPGEEDAYGDGYGDGYGEEHVGGDADARTEDYGHLPPPPSPGPTNW